VNLVAKLAELTGLLEPTAEASVTDLRAARLALAYALLRGQAEATHSLSPQNATPELLSNLGLRDELKQILAEVTREAETRSGEPLDTRVFRRELPVLTNEDPASVPPWAAGLQLDRSLGPFRSFGGWPVWFDLYHTVHQVRVVRAPGAVVLLGLPMRGPIRAATTYRLARGSAWLASQPLSSAAPSGSYTGLRIRSGTLRLSAPAAIVAGVIHVPANVTITLTLQLDALAATPGVRFGPGADAANSSAAVPTEATFVFAPTGLAAVTANDASAVLYGVTVPLRRTTANQVYEPGLNRILIPYTTPLASFTVAQSRSDLFTLSGTAPIAGAAWALSVAVIDPAALGPASGAGALVLQTRSGLQATWRGLAGGTVAVNSAFFGVEPGMLWVTALQARDRRATQTLKLWVEDTTSRRSSIDLRYQQPFPLRYFSLQTGVEVLQLEGATTAHLDRPRRADGMRLGIDLPRTALALFENAAGVSVRLLASLPAPNPAKNEPEKPIALVLTNALLKTTPPRTLTLFGTLDRATPTAVQSGELHLSFELYLLLRTLPDPYAANFNVPLEQSETGARLDCRVEWTHPDTSVLSFTSLPLEADRLVETAAADSIPLPVGELRDRTARDIRLGGATPLFATTDLQQRDPQTIAQEDTARTRALLLLFNETVGGGFERLFLLDVSTNADQFGVCLDFGRRIIENGGAGPIQVQALDLVTAGNNVRLFTLPQIQWEPVYTIQNPDVGPFPSLLYTGPLYSGDDGGPTRFGVNTVELVPIAPRPVLDQILTAFNRDGDNSTAGALFTLPFGMMATASLRLPDDRDTSGAFLNLNQPSFATPSQPLEGGLQLKVTAYSPDDGPDVESPTLAGATIQLRNGKDVSGNALFKSVLDDSVDSIFNREFGPDAQNRRVPVTRIDFSGYGASLFSHWFNPKAQTAETSQVRFDVIVGRTAYEVVQVYSLLYPWAVRVVRTITIQRTGGGAVFRHDSGWVKVSDGVFDFPAHTTDHRKIVTHPGVVKGVFNVRNIRDTAQVYVREYPDGAGTKVKLAAVHFDAEVRISGIVRGGSGGSVTSVDQVGFVQLSPSKDPLTPDQYADFLADQGPLGGPVDCVIDVGGSGQQMRLTRVDVANTQTPGAQVAFAAAGRGSLALPKDGQWSVVRNPASPSDGAQALDRDFGIPLVREGPAELDEAINFNPYQLADPAYMMRRNLAPADYALLWSTGTQRILFARPKIAKNAKAITSDRAPLLADCFALINSTAIFPSASTCLELAANYSLQTTGGGGLRLVLPNAEFPATLAAGGTLRDLANTVATRSYVDYKNTLIKISLDSTNAQSWSYKQTGLEIVNESDGATVKTTQGDIKADSNTAPQFTLIGEKFDQAFFSQVTSIMPLFGTTDLRGTIPPTGITTSLDATHEPGAGEGEEGLVNAGIKVGIDIPEHIPLFIGETLDGGFIEIKTNLTSSFSLEMIVPIIVAFQFKGSVKFSYEWAALTRPLLPKSSLSVPAGSKETVQLAVGAFASKGFAFPNPVAGPFQANFKVFFGLGFIHETPQPLSVAALFTAEGGVQIPPDPSPAFAQAGLKVEGQGTIETEGGDQRLVLQGKIAFELTVAFIVDIEFSSPQATIAKIKL
jgi:hypothetical protein